MTAWPVRQSAPGRNFGISAGYCLAPIEKSLGSRTRAAAPPGVMGCTPDENKIAPDDGPSLALVLRIVADLPPGTECAFANPTLSGLFSLSSFVCATSPIRYVTLLDNA